MTPSFNRFIVRCLYGAITAREKKAKIKTNLLEHSAEKYRGRAVNSKAPVPFRVRDMGLGTHIHSYSHIIHGGIPRNPEYISPNFGYAQ
jgi:hypothetical protein